MCNKSLDSARPLPGHFYLRPTLDVARALIGKILIHRYRDSLLAGIIVEVEAYHGFNDMASHAYGRRKGRSAVMFSRGGIAYVYFTYGMYHCLNVVTECEGYPAAVLIRALEPIAGIRKMQRLRGTKEIGNLTNGPGKLCMALHISKKENGISLLGNRLYIVRGRRIGADLIASSSRIGISRSVEHPWRFFLKGNPYVSHLR